MDSIPVVLFQNEKYFKVTFQGKTLLFTNFYANYIFQKEDDPKIGYDFEVLRDKSILVKGWAYQSEYAKRPVYAVDYTEVYYSKLEPTLSLWSHRHIEGDIICIQRENLEEKIVTYILERMKKNSEFHSMLSNSGERFVRQCESRGIGVRFHISPPSPYPKLVSENTWIVN